MDKSEFKEHFSAAAKTGNILTPKHDPANLGSLYQSFRSVLTEDMADNLEDFIQSGKYVAKRYENTAYPGSPEYIVIEPDAASDFTVPGSGVPSGSPTPTLPLDRLVAVSGQQQGWHVFSESSQTVGAKTGSGDLLFKEELT